MNTAPSITSMTTETGTELVPGQSVQGGGSSPGFTGSPATAAEVSAQISAQEASSLFIVSPVELVGNRDGFAVRTVEFITDATADLDRYRFFISEGRVDRAAGMCRERLLLAPEGQPAARWAKDLALTHIITGRADTALDLLASRYQTALKVGGAFTGRYEVSMGQAQRGRGRFAAAFEHLTAGRIYAEEAGDLMLCARADVSTGRCYTVAGRPDSSHFYFDRAQEVATKFGDWHLLGEIAESRALAYEAEESFEEAERSAWRSIQLLTLTGDKTATAESFETWQRVKARR